MRAIDGADDIDAMFEKPRDRCVLVSLLLAYEDMDGLLCLLREVRSATEVEGGPSCGMRVYAFLGEGNWLAKVNLRNLFCSKRALLFKALETDVEAFRPGAQERPVVEPLSNEREALDFIDSTSSELISDTW